MSARAATLERVFEIIIRQHGEVRMLHYEARDHRRAIEAAHREGYNVISARKADEDKLPGNIEKLLERLHLEDQQRPDLAMNVATNEIIFRKRIKRIENRGKDKDIDNGD